MQGGGGDAQIATVRNIDNADMQLFVERVVFAAEQKLLSQCPLCVQVCASLTLGGGGGSFGWSAVCGRGVYGHLFRPSPEAGGLPTTVLGGGEIFPQRCSNKEEM